MDALSEAFDAVTRSYHAALQTRAASIGALVSSPRGMPSQPTHGQAKSQELANQDWVFASIRAVAYSIAARPVRVARVTGKPKQQRSFYADELKPLSDHPLLDDFSNPSELMSSWAVLYSLVTSMKLTGRMHLWLLRSSREGHQRDMIPLPSSWCEPMDALRGKWLVRPPGFAEPFPVESDEMFFASLPDPSNPFASFSEVQAISKAINCDSELQESQVSAFRMGLQPRLLITVGDVTDVAGHQTSRPLLEPEQRQQVYSAIMEQYGGSRNAGSPIIADKLIQSVTPITTNPSEMDWQESGKTTKSRITQGLGVNPIILGEIEGANRASSVAAESHFARFTVNPLIELISQSMTLWLAPLYARPNSNEQLVAWLDPIVVDDSELILKQYTTALERGACTIDEYRRKVLGLEPIAGGDVRLVPFQLTPARSAKPTPLQAGVNRLGRLNAQQNGHNGHQH